jgi:hypothetical protein
MLNRKIAVTLLAVILIASCAVDPKKENLVNYVNRDMLSIAQIEVVAFERYAAVTGKNYTTDQAVYEALRDEVIPVYKRFTQLLNQIKPDDEEVARIHGLYVKGSRRILKGFELKLFGIADKDEGVITLGNKKIDAGIRQNLEWREQVLALKEERGLLSADRKMSKFEEYLYKLDEVLQDTGPTTN